MESFIIFCLDLFITVIAYLLVPTIFCICRKKFTLSRIKLIATVNGICVMLIFMIIRINAGIDGTSAAVFLWSPVAYFLMKKYCLEIHDDSAPIKKYVVTQVKKANLENIQTQKPKKKKQPLVFVIIALSILLIGSVTYNVVQYNAVKKAQKHITEYIADYGEDGEPHIYKFDFKTNKYLDTEGNEYKE